MSRALKIDVPNRDSYELDQGDPIPEWLESFAENYGKTAVEVARERMPSITEQINSLMGSSARFSSVEEAVQSYQELTGFSEYQKRALASEIIAAGKEDDSEKKTLTSEVPELLDRHPAIDAYIHNVIDTNHCAQLPAILFGILDIFRRDGVSEKDMCPKLQRYISKILAERKPLMDSNESNIGRYVDTNQEFSVFDGNRDPWAGLNRSQGF